MLNFLDKNLGAVELNYLYLQEIHPRWMATLLVANPEVMHPS
jgi:hypothetical protein